MEATRVIQIEVTKVMDNAESEDLSEEQRQHVAWIIKGNIFHDADQVNVTVKDFIREDG